MSHCKKNRIDLFGRAPMMWIKIHCETLSWKSYVENYPLSSSYLLPLLLWHSLHPPVNFSQSSFIVPLSLLSSSYSLAVSSCDSSLILYNLSTSSFFALLDILFVWYLPPLPPLPPLHIYILFVCMILRCLSGWSLYSISSCILFLFTLS